ncbi:hypothetical protein [Suttonella ornithocola]|uniref:Uncharacterized protein n=1 Tax=Suttonella ornithocola TaxID=279832 RepID=A0A380MSL3_9GAMM|nr:hypothetical protein [Suttonella ornithocola]SUO95545.1 Uncharacterised protein [Suttonella ornithocola]
MSGQKNICLLGFPAEAENKLKSIINNFDSQNTYQWVPANDKNLDGVVINAGFLEAPQIQKYIKMISKPVVCAYGNVEGQELASHYGYQSVNWNEKSIDVRAWIDALLGETNNLSSDFKEEKKSDHLHSFKSQSSPNCTNNVNVTQSQYLDSEEVLDYIRDGVKGVYQATIGENITWVKPAEGVVFINYPRDKVPGFHEWQWKKIDERDIPASSRQLKIDLWLFESLWQSRIDGKKYIDTKNYFHLQRWPQPLSRQGRTEALRLAACTQAQPMNIESLKAKTNYPTESICRFLFATLYAGQMKAIKKVNEQDFAPKQVPVDEAKRAEKRSLLQRFRAKLGL